MTSSSSLQIIPPALKFLEDVANKQGNGYLRCVSNGVIWYVYLKDGKIFYINFSIDPLDRLELYTRRIVQDQQFEWRIFDKWRERIAIAKLDDFYPSYDYQSIHSLVRKNRLTASEAVEIIKGITYEAFRNLLLVSQLECSFVSDDREFPILWSSNFLSLAKDCQDEIQGWQAIGSGISSPYQRPFVVRKQEPTQQLENIKKFLIGVDFHHLSLPLKRSPLAVAQHLRPLIDRGLVGLRTPKVPFHKLPHFAEKQDTADFGAVPSTRLQYRVVCIDDSPTILQRMQLFLNSKTFEIFSILDSATALTQIITIKPQIILLDITMPHIDGYKLCSMIRRHPDFKTIPIIMVTSNSGFFDRTRAKLCGATDYLTKPFTQNSLSDMVCKYVED
jgi:two-component system, chemotaxis family, response regulator PixG